MHCIATTTHLLYLSICLSSEKLISTREHGYPKKSLSSRCNLLFYSPGILLFSGWRCAQRECLQSSSSSCLRHLHMHTTRNVCFYIAQYPVHWIAQSALHFTPWQTCSFRHNLKVSGKHSAILQLLREDYSLTFPSLSIAEWTVVSWRERKCPSFETAANVFRTQALSIESPPFYIWTRQSKGTKAKQCIFLCAQWFSPKHIFHNGYN